MRLAWWLGAWWLGVVGSFGLGFASSAGFAPSLPLARSRPTTPVDSVAPGSSTIPSTLPVELRWDAAPGCPDRAEILAAIGRFVAPTVHPEGWRVVAQAEVRATETGWVANLYMRFPEGELRRRIEAQSCAVVSEAAALIVSVLLDPQAVLAELEEPLSDAAGSETSSSESSALLSSESPAKPVTSTPPVVSADEPRSARVTGLLAVGGQASYGILPRWGGGPSLAGGVELGRLRVELRSRFDVPQRVLLPSSEGGARLSLWSTAGLGCFTPTRDRLRLPLCVGPALGWLRARGVGLAQPLTVHRLLVELTGSVAVVYAVRPRLRLRGHVDGSWALTPHRFFIEDRGPLYRTRAGGVSLGLGLEIGLGLEGAGG
ncbi:MAG: hypothetical protein AAGF11_27570 [Myxococcota bacterium]